MEIQYEYEGKLYPVRIIREGEAFRITIGLKSFLVENRELKPGFLTMTINGKVSKCNIATEGNQRHIFINGDVYRFNRVEVGARPAGFDKLPSTITSPISGKVIIVGAKAGDEVPAGYVILTIEAMKMEYQIKAPYAGKVEKVHFKVGDQVDIGALLIDMEKKEETPQTGNSDKEE